MNLDESLIYKLKKYINQGNYPFHMPGHKRNIPESIKTAMQDIYSFDLTEVDGTDELYNAKGIIKEAMEHAAEVYGSDKTYFIINGSSAGVLAAINACCTAEDYIIMAANSHISAYYAVELCRAYPVFIKPEKISPHEIYASVKVQDIVKNIEELKKRFKKTPHAVYITSPTYEGIISDISEIAQEVHKYNIPLIVDEAHGAHLNFFSRYAGSGTDSALKLGADIVIQSLHKTLPAPTQTALIHIKSSLADHERVKYYLKVFSSTSPSYILMSAIDLAVRYMDEDAKNDILSVFKWQKDFREKADKFQYLKVLNPLDIVEYEKKIYKYDITKLIIVIRDKSAVENLGINGNDIKKYLKKYHKIELEMSCEAYALALIGAGDTRKGFDRLFFALKKLDELIGKKFQNCNLNISDSIYDLDCGNYIDNKNSSDIINDIKKTDTDSIDNKLKKLYTLKGSRAKEYIYAYPPGIPLVIPGSYIDAKLIKKIELYLKSGSNIVGI